MTVSGPVTGNGHSLTVTGPGTVVLSGAGSSNINGATVTAGELNIESFSALAGGSNLTVGADYYLFGPTFSVAATSTAAAKGARSTAEASNVAVSSAAISNAPGLVPRAVAAVPYASPIALTVAGRPRTPISGTIADAAVLQYLNRRAAYAAIAQQDAPPWLAASGNPLQLEQQTVEKDLQIKALYAVWAEYGL